MTWSVRPSAETETLSNDESSIGSAMMPSDSSPVQPLVSGTIIFLNAERFIDEAIQSVLAQTYENWELLLVDDGSTDGSTAIARSYAERYPAKIRYLEHPGHKNHGMSASRN